MRWFWKKKREIRIDVKAEQLKREQEAKLEETKKEQTEIYKIVNKAKEIQQRNHFTRDIERALGGIWRQ